VGSKTEYNLLEQFCRGRGINLCCQHRSIKDSIGVDADPNARAATIVCDVRALPFRTGSLDYVICHHGLEHIRDAPLYVLHEWFRVIKAGGTLAIIVPDGSAGESALNYASFRGEVTEYGHGHLFTLEILSELVKFSGGEIYQRRILEREGHKTKSILIAAVKTYRHKPGFQPFSKPVEAMRVLQKNGILRTLKRLWQAHF
jgi:predicted SAM-dependent methyltransferase